MDYYQIAALLAFLFPLAFSPGPGNMFFAANGARFGLRATLGATTGYHIVTFGATFLIGLGFSSALAAAPQAFDAIRIAGSLYVLWLAWKLGTAGRAGHQEAKAASFWDGAVLLILNPKAYVIIALMFSQFLVATSNMLQVAVISVIFTLNNLVAFTLWTTLGDWLGKTFRSEERARYLNATFGVILATVGVWMLVS